MKDSKIDLVLKKIANSYSKLGNEYSYEIFSKEQLQKKSKLFQGIKFQFLIVKTKNGEAAKRGFYVDKRDERVYTTDSRFYQKTFEKHFNVIQKLVRGKK